jgi:type II secretory pathway pseudopilin PulG
MKNLKLKNRGIGLLELMLSLSIIAVLLIMATRYYSSSSQAKKIADVNDQIGIIQNAGNRWLLTHADYSAGTNLITATTNFKDFVDRNYLPSTYYDTVAKTSIIKHPWGGDITVLFTSPTMSITLKNVPNEVATKLQSQYKSILCQTNATNPTLTCPTPTTCDVKFNFIVICP